MDVNVIDEAIERYRAPGALPAAYLERLVFYRKLWGVVAERERACAGRCALDLPARERLDGWLAAGKSMLSQQPVALDRAAFLATMGDLARCVGAETRFPDAEREELARAVNMLPVAVSEHVFERAGSDPRAFVAQVCQTCQAVGAVRGSLPLMSATLSLALRAQLAPIAQRLLAACSPEARAAAHPSSCPVCGSWATVGLVERVPGAGEAGETRALGCTQCGTTWSYELHRCAHCGMRDAEQLQSYHVPGDDRHVVLACNECGEYLRTCVYEPGERVSIDVEDVVMTRLDDALAASAPKE